MTEHVIRLMYFLLFLLWLLNTTMTSCSTSVSTKQTLLFYFRNSSQPKTGIAIYGENIGEPACGINAHFYLSWKLIPRDTVLRIFLIQDHNNSIRHNFSNKASYEIRHCWFSANSMFLTQEKCEICKATNKHFRTLYNSSEVKVVYNIA